MTSITRRYVIVTAAAFVVGFAIGALLLGLLLGPTSPGESLLAGIILGSFGAFSAGTLASLTLNNETRTVTRGDPALARKLRGTVMRGFDMNLDADELLLAIPYAEAAVREAALRFANVTFLYIALVLSRIDSLLGKADALNYVLLVVLLVFYAVATPIFLRQLFRTRAYVRSHPQPSAT